MSALDDIRNLVDDGVGRYLADEHPLVVNGLKALASVLQSIETVGTVPADVLQYVHLGDGSNFKAFRIGYNGTDLFIQRNSGTQASPVYENSIKISGTDGAVTLIKGLTIAGALVGVTGLTLSGVLNMGGQNITSVAAITATSINGVDPASHAARHNPGGSDALALGSTPPAVASSGATGSATNFARGDHTHKGVSSLDANASGSPLFGAIDIANGPGVQISKAAQVITIKGPARLYAAASADQAISGTTETDITTLTALTLPVITAVDTKNFRVRVTLSISNGATPANDLTIRLYSGTNGTKADTEIALTKTSFAVAADFTNVSFEIVYSPSADTDIKLGLSIQGLANSNVLGASNAISNISVEEVV